MQFLFRWHGLTDKVEGVEGLAKVLEQLEGVSLPAAA